MRAQAIGTTVYERKDSGFTYARYKFKIPGTHYKFYFRVDNAFDPKRPHSRKGFYDFTSDEIDELERWVAWDEKIFAECNQQYSAQQH